MKNECDLLISHQKDWCAKNECLRHNFSCNNSTKINVIRKSAKTILTNIKFDFIL
jgi:hypothetical protein